MRVFRMQNWECRIGNAECRIRNAELRIESAKDPSQGLRVCVGRGRIKNADLGMQNLELII